MPSLTLILDTISQGNFHWIAKRLSGNDTGLTGGHQAGVYLPRSFFEMALPELNSTSIYNHRLEITYELPQYESGSHQLSAIYYNSKHFPEKGLKKKYDEFRLTGWGGNNSPVQNADNTGAIFLFALRRGLEGYEGIAIVAESLEDELLCEEWIGEPVEPGNSYQIKNAKPSAKELSLAKLIPSEWLSVFPSGSDIFSLVVKLKPRKADKNGSCDIDKLLLDRRSKEYEIFTILEQAHVFPSVSGGFNSVEDFLKLAHSVANRRKSRSGSSLERNLAQIFTEESISFEEQVMTEHRKKPDFVFPSGADYHNPHFPNTCLRMLAAKTCCKDRWRQILNEAARIEKKHLFTLQEGISSNQLVEMESEGLKLVVPRGNLRSFPEEWRSKISDLDSFIVSTKALQTKG